MSVVAGAAASMAALAYVNCFYTYSIKEISNVDLRVVCFTINEIISENIFNFTIKI